MPPDLLSEPRLRLLMDACLRGAPFGPLRLFAYGSLIWERPCEILAASPCRVAGLSRRYCLWDESNRGTLSAPSLTLGLVAGGESGGVVLTLADAEALWPAWKQEMTPGAYTAIWVEVAGFGPALTFLADPTHRLFAGQRPDLARLIAGGEGPNGTASEYLVRTTDALQRQGMPDPDLEALRAAIEPRAAA